MQSIRILAIAAGWAIAVFGLAAGAWAQTIDTSAARATVGAPLHLTLRVRDFEPGPASLGRDCLEAHVQQGDATIPAQPLRWHSSARAGEGDTWVTLTSARAIEEPILRIKVALLCGASFIREFTLLAEAPPPARPAPSRSASKQGASRPARSAPPAARTPATVDHAEVASISSGSIPSESAALTGAPARPAAPLVAAALPSASPLTDAFVQLWQQDMQSVREDLRQSRAALASMKARLERSERDTWQIWGGLTAMASGLAMVAGLWRVVRDLRLRRFTRIDEPAAARPSAHPDTPEAEQQPVAPAATARMTVPIEAVAAPVPAPTRTPTRTSTPAPAAEPPSADTADQAEMIAWDEPPDSAPSRWSKSDFGQPALDEVGHAELLAKVDAITAGGYYGASVAVLENALQSRVGKSASILLRLLDLYRLLNQPWNHERVSAEIEAIYNVQLPSIDQPDEGRNLDQHERTWQEISLSWGSAQAADQLVRVLVRPTRIEVLDLAAFRDALMLHTMCTLRDADPIAPVEPIQAPDNSTSDARALPALQWRVQGSAA